MSAEREILGVLANRRDSMPEWARDLLAPYVPLSRVISAGKAPNPNECAMTPTRRTPMRIGTVVVFGKHHSNGTHEHPAIVTRVWGDEEFPTVNLKVIPDCDDPFDSTSVQYWKSQGWASERYYREA